MKSTFSICLFSTLGVQSRLITVTEFSVDPASATDFTEVNTVLTFQEGQLRQDVLVPIRDDQDRERMEAFELYISEPSPSSTNVIVYPNIATVYIVDDDGGLPPIVNPTSGPDGGKMIKDLNQGI